MDAMLDAQTVLRWCRAALTALGEAREEIDALNVFPVPDTDTGTNLYLTVESAARAAEAVAEGDSGTAPATASAGDSLVEVVHAIAEGALVGARGNSGAILAQMLRGVADVLASSAPADGEVFAEALARGASQGRMAVAHPVEGTMLTVASAAADGAAAAAADGGELPQVALAASTWARDALARTPDQLAALRLADVVDAGGRGLTVILDAFDTVLTGRRALPKPRAFGAHRVPEVAAASPPSRSAPGFEVMYLLDAPETAVPGLRAGLESLGDSVVVAGGESLWKVHVHVDDVGAAIEAGVTAGRPHRIRVSPLDNAHVSAASPGSGRALVAFAAGDGLAELFGAAGAAVVRTRLGQRPSIREMLGAIHRSGAREVVVLPNESGSIPAAEAAAADARGADLRVAVIPTRAQVQGLAAAAVHEPARAFDSDVIAMTTAAGHTRHAAVTVAIREAVTSAGVCQPGDVLGVVEGDFAVIGENLLDVAVEVVRRALAAGGELVTLVAGAGADDALAAAVAAAVRTAHPEVDAVVYSGGQPRYPLLIGVE